ncbi:unnamed protein product [Rotaria sp. Silwood1]|nr:unnamed protein product [Rotaria sp. Silwood1]CAF1461766.1 unnamed protein product [Rotaria sp. Silwood1]CAF3571890.1 unnamed protein product [Rotaria sp. Silwood1]CAF4709346.1 unnamed protein product [Rotaria sp. Silwood1]CAF4891791.1 unnamed protein product [Rotaria sp. Silwood1]
MDSNGSQHLANALRNNKTLATLNLGLNKIGDDGVQYLAEALRNNYVIYNSITSVSYTRYAESSMESNYIQ